MNEWIKANLMDSIGRFNKSRMNESWFIKNGHSDKYQTLIKLSRDIKEACRILLYRRKCKCCEKYVFKPNTYCGQKCMWKDPEHKEKVKTSTYKKYGVDNVFKNNEIKEKIKKKMVDRYGVEHAIQSKEIQEKKKATNLERYGDIYPAKTEFIKEKIKQSCLLKYGVEHQLQSKEIQEKLRNTNLIKYGKDNTFQVEEFKNKSINTMKQRYGVEHALQSKEIQERYKKTCISKYGVDNPMKLASTKEAIKKTIFDKYGKSGVKPTYYTNNLLQQLELGLPNVDSIHDPIFNCVKSVSTIYRLIHVCKPDFKFGGSMSYPHKLISEEIEKQGYSVKNNDRTLLGGLEIDIYIPELNLGFEFNGTYWHSEEKVGKYYHQNKSILAKEKGVQLIHLYEYNGYERNIEIVKSFLKEQIDKNISIFDNHIKFGKCEYRYSLVDGKTTIYIEDQSSRSNMEYIISVLADKLSIKSIWIEIDLDYGHIGNIQTVNELLVEPYAKNFGTLKIFNSGKEILEWQQKK